jgi:hypothetical protein
MKARHAWLAGVTSIAALLLVFAAYLRPDMMLTLATQLWNCF